MNRYDRLMKRSHDKAVIQMDGAPRTEIERRVRSACQFMELWETMPDPDTVMAVNEEYRQGCLNHSKQHL